MKPFFKHWRVRPSQKQQLLTMEQWYKTERGQRLLARETELVSQALTQAFGYHLLQLSVDSQVELFKNSRVQRKYRCHPFNPAADTICQTEQLPFASESLDVVILHHVQEFIGDPHPLLREVQRVVVPNGQVLILGFNPWSGLGVRSMIPRVFPESNWHNRLLTCYRMKDWLGLLGFETLQVDYGMRVPAAIPKHHSKLVDTLWRRWPFGSFYLISAVKQVATITPVRPKWKAATNGFTSLSPVKTRPVGSQLRFNTGVHGDTLHAPSLYRSQFGRKVA